MATTARQGRGRTRRAVAMGSVSSATGLGAACALLVTESVTFRTVSPGGRSNPAESSSCLPLWNLQGRDRVVPGIDHVEDTFFSIQCESHRLDQLPSLGVREPTIQDRAR